jgi:uncharacterized protein Usg
MWVRKSLVTLDVLYYMPDYTDIIQEFVWQTEDDTPNLPRVHTFLNYWKDNIEAAIKEVSVAYTYETDDKGYKSAIFHRELKSWH